MHGKPISSRLPPSCMHIAMSESQVVTRLRAAAHRLCSFSLGVVAQLPKTANTQMLPSSPPEKGRVAKALSFRGWHQTTTAVAGPEVVPNVNCRSGAS